MELHHCKAGCCQFTRVRGVRIAELSAIPSELEILVEPPAVFKAKMFSKRNIEKQQVPC